MKDDIVIRIDRRGAALLGAAALVVGTAGVLCSETLTLSTSYPVPVGVYNQLITTGDAGSAPLDTVLARNAGNVVLAPSASGRVGVGTSSPSRRLSVAGDADVSQGLSVGAGLSLGRLSTPPAGAADGTIYYDTALRRFRGRQDGTWVDLAGGGQSDVGVLRWNGTWEHTPDAVYSCDAGYRLVSYHYGCGGCSNGANWKACVRDGVPAP